MNIEGKRIVCLDFESVYSTEYSLSKMTTAEYVRDSRFEAIGVGVSVNFEFPHWHHGAGIWKVLRELELDREDTIAVYHNAIFDAAITEWHYGIRHNQILCTMMGAGPTLVPFSPQNRRSLAKLATLCDVGPKGGYLATVKGKRYHGLSTEELCKLGEYCVNDVEITNELAKKILRDLPESEIKLVDLTVRKFVRPEIILDKEVLQEHLMSEQGRKARLLEDCDIDDPALLRSNDKFAELLARYGAVPPTKVSLVTKKETYAFAKTDPGFKELLNEGPPDVQALCAARVGFKSTLEETRAQRFLRCADLDAPFSAPLLYWGARTGRFSGMDKLNLQNIPKKGNLRRSMTAPPGHQVVAGDLSQVECLGANTFILTYARGYVPITSVHTTDLLWDGVEWVRHGGVIYKGQKETITYGGITGTPNHIVYLTDGRRVYLTQAAATGAQLAIGERDGEAIWALGGAAETDSFRWKLRQAMVPLWRLWAGISSWTARFTQRQIKSMPQSTPHAKRVLQGATRPSSTTTTNTVQPHYLCYKSEQHKQSVRFVPSARYRKPVQIVRRFRAICMGAVAEIGLLWAGDRPNQQRWPLCTGQYPIIYARTECAASNWQYNGVLAGRIHERSTFQTRSASSISCIQHSANDKERSQSRTDCTTPNNPANRSNLHTEDVYDILNAGPRHRFTANGRIVSNCRVLATLAGQKDLVEIFRDPTRDAYREFGTELYKLPPAEINTQQRHVSKMGRLALGFGQGHDKFRATLAASWIPVHVTKQEALRIVQTYRRTHPRIVRLWDVAGVQWIPKMMGNLGDRRPIREGPLTIGIGFIGLPNGTSIQYPNLTTTRVNGQEEVWYGLAGNQQHRLWGSKCVENVVQALARIILTSAELWLAERGWHSCLSVHDELVYVVHDEHVEKFKQVLHKVLTRPVPWMPDLPLNAEVTSGQNYADQA